MSRVYVMRDTKTARADAKPDAGASAASENAFEQTTVLQGLVREWRENVAGIRRALSPGRREEPPAAGWTDIRHAVSPLESVQEETSTPGRFGRFVENGKWVILTVVPVAFAWLFALRSKKFRD